MLNSNTCFVLIRFKISEIETFKRVLCCIQVLNILLHSQVNYEFEVSANLTAKTYRVKTLWGI